MPYINQVRRRSIEKQETTPNVPGTLNYAITKIIHNYIKDNGLCYNNLNEVIGVLECAKQEFYRAVAAPYEDIKRKENGSISELDKEKSDE